MTNPLIDARDRFAQTHPERRIDLNGRDWGMIDTGAPSDDAPVLILIPGTLGRADIFWQQIAALSGRARVIATTYPANGGIAEWVADLGALMEVTGIRSAAVLGSSLGGYLAQAFAAASPDRVAHLIAANTLGDTTGLDQRPPYSFDLDNGPIDTLRDGFGNGLRAWAKAHPDQADLVDLLLKEVGGRIPEPELRARLKALKVAPSLSPCPLPPERISTIEADDDPLIPQPMRDAVRRALNPAHAWRFSWGGHFPYVVRPEAYTAILEQVLGLTERTAPGEYVL